MKAKAVVYWICTALIAFAFVSGGIAYVMRVPQVVEGVSHLGYPIHFVVLLGIWKILGGLVILAPRLPRLKEWAYAGMIFDLTGAPVAHSAANDDVRHIVTPLVLCVIVLASWALRPESRKLRAWAEPTEWVAR